METAKIIDFPKTKTGKKDLRARDRLNIGKTGRVYSRGGQLLVDFYYLGERVRERSRLDDNQGNLELLRKKFRYY
jgi:hypothetical protein